MIFNLGNGKKAGVLEYKNRIEVYLAKGYGELTPVEKKKAIKMYYGMKNSLAFRFDI